MSTLPFIWISAKLTWHQSLVVNHNYPKPKYLQTHFIKDTNTIFNRYGNRFFEMTGLKLIPCPVIGFIIREDYRSNV
jgi:hypothetical protein